MKERPAVASQTDLAYTHADKSRILDELVDLTGFDRDYARQALRQALASEIVSLKLGRSVIYTPDLMSAR